MNRPIRCANLENNSQVSLSHETPGPQGLTLSFQARGSKRSFDKNMWSKTEFLVIIHTILCP